MSYYFAYGSNLLGKRLERRIGHINKIGNYILKGYKLKFNCGTRAQTFANIIKTCSTKDFVEGVLYEVTFLDLLMLDYYEGYYDRIRVGEVNGYPIYTYISRKFYLVKKERPDSDYLKIILNGCNENDLYHTANHIWINYKRFIRCR